MPNEPSSGDSASSEAAGFCILAIASLPVLDVVGATLVSSELHALKKPATDRQSARENLAAEDAIIKTSNHHYCLAKPEYT
tara:strand:- start:275 stop:517 length:243 start_codon:yes stop_codon:yes gene_type:complete